MTKEVLFRRRKRFARFDVHEERNLEIPRPNNGELVVGSSRTRSASFPFTRNTRFSEFLLLFIPGVFLSLKRNQIKSRNAA